MKIRKNKKAVELNVTTIIIVILAVLALVIIALAFTGGMGKMWQTIVSFFTGTSGLEARQVAQQCNLNIGESWFFCCHKHNTRLFGNVTCWQLGPKIGWSDFDPEAQQVTCNDFEDCKPETQ